MSNAATPTTRPHAMQPHNARFVGWLAAALFLHALLLLIPAREHFSPSATLQSLTIALSGGRRTPPREPPSPPPTAVERANEPGPPVTAAGLLDDAHRREWNLPEPSDPPRLGVFKPPPSNPWPASPAASADQRGADLPSRNGVIDHWLAADGSHNFMIRASNGQVLCGRAEAWNPMSPLVEPVMMYRACGNGRRTFEMPARPGHVLLR
jgi:hypothetical protein